MISGDQSIQAATTSQRVDEVPWYSRTSGEQTYVTSQGCSEGRALSGSAAWRLGLPRSTRSPGLVRGSQQHYTLSHISRPFHHSHNTDIARKHDNPDIHYQIGINKFSRTGLDLSKKNFLHDILRTDNMKFRLSFCQNPLAQLLVLPSLHLQHFLKVRNFQHITLKCQIEGRARI